MHTKKILFSLIGGALAIFSANVMAANSEEHKLAESHGCIACHALQPASKTGKNPRALPIGPSMQEIAERYHANKSPGKYQELYRIVKHGSSPYRSKWQGKISGLAMPPNDDTISDLDINRLLVWILTDNHSGK